MAMRVSVCFLRNRDRETSFDIQTRDKRVSIPSGCSMAMSFIPVRKVEINWNSGRGVSFLPAFKVKVNRNTSLALAIFIFTFFAFFDLNLDFNFDVDLVFWRIGTCRIH